MKFNTIDHSKRSKALLGNTRRLGYKESEETKRKKSLALKGRIPWNKGIVASEKTKQKLSSIRKGKVFSWMHRTPSNDTKNKLSETSKRAWSNPDIRKKYHIALQKTKWLKVRTDIGQLDFLDKWNRLGFQFEPNYQLYIDGDLFYIDGYDKTHNVVIEYDGKYHKKTKQKEKDLIRQKKIISTLSPKKFWRYNALTQTIQNVTGD